MNTLLNNKRGSSYFTPVVVILIIAMILSVGLAYMDYRKHGQFEFTAPAILFATLVFSLSAPLYIWSVIGM